MKKQSFFVRLQLFSFVLLAIVLGMATYFLPQRNQQDFIRTLNNNTRTQYAVVSSFEQIRTSFYVYQRSLTRWLETGSSLWAQLVPQSQAVLEKRLDALELDTQNEAATPILAAVAQLRGHFNDYFAQVNEHLVMDSDQGLKVPLETRQLFVAGSADLLGAVSSLEQSFHDNIQASVGAVSKIFTQRLQQTRWALGLGAGLMLLWGGVILIQVIRQNKRLVVKFEIRNSKFETNEEIQKIRKEENIIEPPIDLILPCHMQTYDWEQGAAAVFEGQTAEIQNSKFKIQNEDEEEEVRDQGAGVRGEGLGNSEEEENTEKARLLELERTTPAEDEVLREVDEILAREIPQVNLQGIGVRGPAFTKATADKQGSGVRGQTMGDGNVLVSPAANDYPDVVIALHQEDFQQQHKISTPTDASQLYEQTAMPGVQVVNGGGEEVIMVDFGQERNDLAQRFRKKQRSTSPRTLPLQRGGRAT